MGWLRQREMCTGVEGEYELSLDRLLKYYIRFQCLYMFICTYGLGFQWMELDPSYVCNMPSHSIRSLSSTRTRVHAWNMALKFMESQSLTWPTCRCVWYSQYYMCARVWQKHSAIIIKWGYKFRVEVVGAVRFVQIFICWYQWKGDYNIYLCIYIMYIEEL